MMLYLHIPFCKRKCAYCAFYSQTNPKKQAEYVAKLCDFITQYGGEYRTVYIGGGTPSALPLSLWQRLLSTLQTALSIGDLEEFTVELNPESTTPELLSLLKENGVTRLSFGIQSLSDGELAAIGRLHDAKTALSALSLARQAGFTDLSADLIYGLPGQTVDSFSASLTALLSENITHLSCYNLQIEAGTPLFDIADRFSFPNEDEELKMYDILIEKTRAAGFRHYEISNFCKDGYKARHNSGYWTGEDYIGLGPGAHSKIGNTRFSFAEDTDHFIGKTDFAFDEQLKLSETDLQEERIMLSLRTDAGVPLSLVDRQKVRKYIDAGWGTVQNDRFILNDSGMLVSNTIISDLF